MMAAVLPIVISRVVLIAITAFITTKTSKQQLVWRNYSSRNNNHNNNKNDNNNGCKALPLSSLSSLSPSSTAGDVSFSYTNNNKNDNNKYFNFGRKYQYYQPSSSTLLTRALLASTSIGNNDNDDNTIGIGSSNSGIINNDNDCSEILIEGVEERMVESKKEEMAPSSLYYGDGDAYMYSLSKLCDLFAAKQHTTDLLSLRSSSSISSSTVDPDDNEKNTTANNDSASAMAYRGVYLNRAVQENEIILSVPLTACLRDDSPPDWLLKTQTKEILQNEQEQERNNYNDNNIDNDNDTAGVSVEGWVTRLTASLLDLQMKNKHKLLLSSSCEEGQRIWLDLLPTNLRELLPIHWDDDATTTANNNNSNDSDNGTINLLDYTGSRSLQLAVDSAYFARLIPIGDIMASLKHIQENNNNINNNNRKNDPTFSSSSSSSSWDYLSGITQKQVEDAVDLVQTRACRAEGGGAISSSSSSSDHLRVMVPIFDMINHSREYQNAEFLRQGNTTMIVRALRNITANEELFINYGDYSTRPAWKCLFSYGFVPPYLSSSLLNNNGNEKEEAVPLVYEDDAADITLNDDEKQQNFIVEVGPTELPYELVRYEAIKIRNRNESNDNKEEEEEEEEEEVSFTPEIGLRIVQRLLTAAKQLENDTSTTTTTTTKTSSSVSLSSLAGYRSVLELRESNRRTLLACAEGLKEFMMEEENEEESIY